MTHAQLLAAIQQPRQRQLFLPLNLCKSNYLFLRWVLWWKDPHCFYCRKRVSRKKSTLDHVLPKSKGGQDTIDNLVLCCRDCNTAKGSMTLLEWLEKILRAYLRVQEGRVTHVEVQS